MVLATLINLMLKKYFSVLVEDQIVNVICECLNVGKDMSATLADLLNIICRIPKCYKSDLVSHSNLVSHFKRLHEEIISY